MDTGSRKEGRKQIPQSQYFSHTTQPSPLSYASSSLGMFIVDGRWCIRNCGDFGKSNKVAGFRRIAECKRPLSAAKVSRSRGYYCTQAIRPFGVCAASDAVGMRAKGVGVPKEAFRDAARTCTMQDEEDGEVQTTQ